MIQLLKELWYKYKVRSCRKLIAKLTAKRRKLNEKQKELTASVDTYVEDYNKITKL